MNAGNSNQQKFSDAGEQAGRVISEFISIADNFSKRFEKEFSAKNESCRRAPGDGNNSIDGNGSDSAPYSDFSSDRSASDRSGDLENELHKAGEYLRELREAAGYSVDGFAKAINRQGAARKIKSVEEGRDVFPDDWLDQISALLKQNDPLAFFEKIRRLYDSKYQSDVAAESSDDYTENADSVAGPTTGSAAEIANKRRQKLQSIFNDEQLGGLSDGQFEELMSFAEINFQAALQLVRKK